MATQNEDEALNQAILASIQDEQGKRRGLESKRSTVTLDHEPEPINKRPPPPSEKPPHSGMVLTTTIKNGWVTQEWR